MFFIGQFSLIFSSWFCILTFTSAPTIYPVNYPLQFSTQFFSVKDIHPYIWKLQKHQSKCIGLFSSAAKLQIEGCKTAWDPDAQESDNVGIKYHACEWARLKRNLKIVMAEKLCLDNERSVTWMLTEICNSCQTICFPLHWRNHSICESAFTGERN